LVLSCQAAYVITALKSTRRLLSVSKTIDCLGRVASVLLGEFILVPAAFYETFPHCFLTSFCCFMRLAFECNFYGCNCYSIEAYDLRNAICQTLNMCSIRRKSIFFVSKCLFWHLCQLKCFFPYPFPSLPFLFPLQHLLLPPFP